MHDTLPCCNVVYGLVAGHLIEILIAFQRSNCSSFITHAVGKHPWLELSIKLMNIVTHDLME